MTKSYTDYFQGPLRSIARDASGRIVSDTTINQNSGMDSVSVSNLVRNPVQPGGWRNPSAYTMNKWYYSAPYGVIRRVPRNYPYAVSENIGWNPYNLARPSDPRSEFNPIMDKHRPIAETKALLKLKDQKINLAQAFAERKQTAGLLAEFALRSAQTIVDLRNGQLNRAARRWGLEKHPSRSSKTIAQLWLELQYGWKPALSDVFGACEALAELDRSDPYRYGVSVRAKSWQSIDEVKFDDTKVNPQQKIYNRLKGKAGCYVRLDYTLANPILGTMSSLGISDPQVLAWELLPWSFVVDWALPVGDWLASLTAANGFSFRGGTATKFYDGRSVGYHDVDFTDAYGERWKGSAHSKQHWKRVERTVYYSSPLPRFPGLKNPVSWLHLANALALMRGAFRVR